MKRPNTVKQICSNWHGGQWYALYQFASSGIYVPENHLRYLKELQECNEPEYYLHPGKISKKDSSDLNGCIKFFESLGKDNGIETEWAKHTIYGYKIPYLTGNTNKIQVRQLTAFI